jgi:penicillin G amidase
MRPFRQAITLAEAFAFAAMAAMAATALAAPARAQDRTPLTLPGLEHPVEILRDRWGINHIYAQSEHDLFFAQGWAAARDRLFQLELWRRQATGRWPSCSARARSSATAARGCSSSAATSRARWTTTIRAARRSSRRSRGDGINAYVDQANTAPEQLPIEFRLLGTRPRRWTPDVVISRHQGLLGNLTQELTVGRAVASLGAERVKQLNAFGPGDPDLTLDAGHRLGALAPDILAVYNAFRAPLRFRPEDVIASARAAGRADADGGDAERRRGGVDARRGDIGSNNWVVSGRLSESGRAIMANDPHRAQSAPSLRYWVHLVAPGWNVIGGGEPVLPGVSIGHNEYGAWGLTIFSTDGEDLLRLRDESGGRRSYRYRGRVGTMRVIRESIP